MCGIVGYIAKTETTLPLARQHFLRHALSMDTLRGSDSTGVATVSKEFVVDACRSTSAGDAFVQSNFYKKFNTDGWATIGHNRAATRGSVKINNAHPFRFGAITLVHNGTLDKKGANFSTFDPVLEVDSMQIALALSKCEAKEANTVLSYIDGGFCILWFDERDKSINMARNYDRPMHVMSNVDETLLMFMSDGNMLTILNRNLSRSAAHCNTVWEIDTYKHMKWQYGSIIPKVTAFKRYVPPAPPVQPRLPHNQQSIRGRSPYTPPVNNATPGPARAVHKAVLKKIFDVDDDRPLRFEPSGDTWQMTVKGITMVEGVVHLPLTASQAKWEAVIMSVPTETLKIKGDQDWTVRAIGIGKPTRCSFDPCILCEVESFSWSRVSKQTPLDDEPSTMENKDVIIRGPDGTFVEPAALNKLLQLGCVSCGANMGMEDATTASYTNEGRDLLCFDCKWEQR